MDKIILGSIGTGVIVHSILDAVRETEGISLGAVYSRSKQRGSALARQYGVEKVYTNLEEMLEDNELNFIYIASPNSLHYLQAKLALEHGKNVICEKPFCVRREEVEELGKIADKRELFLIDAVPMSFLPNFKILKKQLSKVGRIRLVLSNYTQFSSRYLKLKAGEPTNIFSLEYAGGCLSDINFYNIYLNVALFGKPNKIKYFANVFPGAADTSGIVLMKYDGFVSSCAGSKDARGESMVRIEGEDGYISISGGSNLFSSVRVVTENSDETHNDQGCSNRWLYEIQTMTQLILEDDRKAFRQRLRITADVIETLERARCDADIVFPNI